MTWALCSPPAVTLSEMNAMHEHELRLVFTALQPITPRDLFAIRGVSPQWRQVAASLKLWHALMARSFASILEAAVASAPIDDGDEEALEARESYLERLFGRAATLTKRVPG